ncbi:hypothetical protein IJJ97_03130 [bacterium]|nr:hypothetical protein [bacterium]
MLEFLTKESRERVEKRIKEAEARGKKVGLLETAKKLLKLGLSLDKISELTTLTKSELQTIAI